MYAYLQPPPCKLPFGHRKHSLYTFLRSRAEYSVLYTRRHLFALRVSQGGGWLYTQSPAARPLTEVRCQVSPPWDLLRSDRVQNTACCTRRSRLVTYSIRYSVLYSIMYSILHSIMYSIMHRIQYSMLAGISQMEGCLSVQPNPQCGLLRRRLAGNTPAKYHTVHVIFHKLHDLSPTA